MVCRCSLLPVLLFYLILAGSTFAQSSPTTASITGIVRNSAGEVVPNVSVKVRDLSTNQTRRTTADADGSYRINALVVSSYEIRVELPGFAVSVIPNVTLVLGQTTTLDITLQPEGVSAAVEVSDKPLTIDTSQTALTTSIVQESIEELPVKSRNYLQFTLLAPGVAPSNTQSATGAGTIANSPLGDSGFTFGGLRARSNSISIDGLSNTDETTGASLIVLSPEIVREFQIINNGISAEFGGAAGGTINVITKTGSNQFHGTAFTFLQNQRFNARNPFDARRRLFHTYQPGFSLGGPLKKDKLFFYMAAEQEYTIANDEPEINRNVRSSINAALAAGFAPRLAVRALRASPFRVGTAQTELSGKLTYLANSFNTANLRFAFTNNRSRGDAFNTSTLNDASARGNVYSKDYQVTGSLISVLKRNVINDARAQFSRRRFLSRSGDQIGPEIDIVGLARFGRPFDADTDRRETRKEFVDTATLTHGGHEFKTGGSLNHVSLKSDLRDGFGGIYTFRSVDDFLAGRPAFWRQAFGEPHTNFAVTSFGAFLQDRWRVSPKLVLNLGFRYAVEKLPTPFQTDQDDLSPRLGLAWSPSKEWVFRAGFGVFHDRLPLAFLNPAIQKNGANAFEQVAYDALAAQVFTDNGGGVVTMPVANIAPSVYRAEPRIHTPHSIQTFVGVERLLAVDTTLRAEFLFTHGSHLPRTRNINLLPPVDPRYDAVYQLEDSARSTYRGLSLSVNKRFSSEITALASYTLSKVTDDASDFNEQPVNPNDLRAERGPSLLDVRHRLVLSGVFELPFGDEKDKNNGNAMKDSLFQEILGDIEIAPIVTISSGRPVDPLTGVDEERNRAFPVNSRPLGFGRNSLTTPSFFNADLRVVKYVPLRPGSKLDFAFEFFNLFNHPNVAAINPFFGPNSNALPTFKTPILFNSTRQFRFSLDLEF